MVIFKRKTLWVLLSCQIWLQHSSLNSCVVMVVFASLFLWDIIIRHPAVDLRWPNLLSDYQLHNYHLQQRTCLHKEFMIWPRPVLELFLEEGKGLLQTLDGGQWDSGVLYHTISINYTLQHIDSRTFHIYSGIALLAELILSLDILENKGPICVIWKWIDLELPFYWPMKDVEIVKTENFSGF